MNIYLIAAVSLIFAILGGLVYQRFTKPAQASAKASAVSDVVTGLLPHVETALASAKDHAEALVADLRAELHPAAPAASVAVPPPSAAPAGEPSAGGGGTAPVQVVVTASDAVLAKHAQLDQVIATHQAAIADAQSQKAAVTAAQDALNKLVA